MPRLVTTTLIAAFAVATVLPSLASAQQIEPKKHVRHRPPHVQYVAAPDPYYAAPGPYYYGAPGTYYPAPPFPFFLLPGPWWLPAHP